MEIFALKINQALEQSLFDKLLLHVDKEKRESICAYKDKAQASISLASRLLIKYLINAKLGIPFSEITFETNQYGKPFLKNAVGFEFNLSHSELWIVCAIDEFPIGIDIEKINANIEQPIEILSPSEKKYYEKLAENDQLKFFYQVWTRKESFLKAKGIGLNCDLQKLEVINDNGKIINFQQKYFSKDYDFVPNYAISVCAQHEQLPEEINLIEASVLINSFNN